MTTNVLTCAKFTAKPGSVEKFRNANALRYDNLTRALAELEERAPVPVPPKRDRKAGTGQSGILELRAHVAALKAENERLRDRITEDLEGLADRLAELEARVQRPFWRRVFGSAGNPPPPAARAHRKMAERLRSIFSDRAQHPSRNQHCVAAQDGRGGAAAL
jgi:hypothetical protein